MDERYLLALDEAAGQHALVTRTRARAVGLTDRMIDLALADGFLIPVWREVFRVRGAPQTERMAMAAAALGAVGHASDSTAARLLQLGAPLPLTPLHVSVDVIHQHPRSRVVPIEIETVGFFPVTVHRRSAVAATVLTIDGIPCADAARTLIDIAPSLAVDDLEDAFERARRLGLVSTAGLATGCRPSAI